MITPKSIINVVFSRDAIVSIAVVISKLVLRPAQLTWSWPRNAHVYLIASIFRKY